MPERTILITSLSKFVAPGLRVGIVVVPPNLVNAVIQKHTDFSIAAPALPALTLSEAMNSGLLEFAARCQIEAIAERSPIARRYLGPDRVKSPAGSLHLWVELPDSRQVEEVIFQLAARGIKLANGRYFAVDPRADIPYLRISLGPLQPARMDADLATIARTIHQAPAGQMAI